MSEITERSRAIITTQKGKRGSIRILHLHGFLPEWENSTCKKRIHFAFSSPIEDFTNLNLAYKSDGKMSEQALAIANTQKTVRTGSF